MISRRTCLAAGLATMAVGLTGCNSSAGSPDTGATGDQSPSDGGAFPATISTKFGDITVDKLPTRVVALGWGDAETALELGIQPVGASDWLDFGGDGVGPWSKGAYDTPPTIIQTLEPSYEKIAGLAPDLILDVRSSGDDKRYQKLSAIATTIGVPKDGADYLVNPDQQVTMIGKALGQSAKAAQILKDLDAQFAKMSAAHPEWKGKTVSVATKTSQGWGAYTEGEGRVAFMEQLGFELAPKIAALKPNSSGFSVTLSDEQLDLLDADVIVAFPIYIEASDLTGDPLWKNIPAVRDGRSIVIGGMLSKAYSENTPGSQRYALTKMEPLLQKAVPA